MSQVPIDDYVAPENIRLPRGLLCYVREDGKRQGWMVSSSKPGRGNGKQRGGYEYYRVGNRSLAHHRILAYAWGMIDTVFNDKEIDHCKIPLRDLNVEWNLQPLGRREHGVITYHRSSARKQDQIQLNLEGDPI